MVNAEACQKYSKRVKIFQSVLLTCGFEFFNYFKFEKFFRKELPSRVNDRRILFFNMKNS